MRTVRVSDKEWAEWARWKRMGPPPVYEVKHLNDDGDLVTITKQMRLWRTRDGMMNEAQRRANRYGASVVYRNGLPYKRFTRTRSWRPALEQGGFTL